MEVQVGCNGSNVEAIKELAAVNNLKPTVICVDDKDEVIFALGFEGEELDVQRFIEEYSFHSKDGWN